MDTDLLQQVLKPELLAKFPQHIAMILDGNGRWATAKHLPIQAGHKQGADTLIQLLKDIRETTLPIKTLTVYAFSTENWQRPKEEVNYLLNLFMQYIEQELSQLPEQQIKVNVIGSKANLTPDLLEHIQHLEQIVPMETKLTLNIAFNYGGRCELTEAVKAIVNDTLAQRLHASAITEELLSQYMYQPQIDKIDLLIRTGGYNRISNFLLWQLAYAELYFTDVLWPDFTINDLLTAIVDFQQRERKYGKRS